MPLDEPGWWYGPGDATIVRLLTPLEQLYARLAVRRLTRRQPYRSRLPVICVGNFTAGGTGKTPLTLYLAERLKEMGERPAILTRGYGGRVKGPHWVDASNDRACDVGDEPLLLARVGATLISRDRRTGAIAIETDAADYTVILMDDGLQNPSLVKDLTLAVIDQRRGTGNGHVIPAGPLRAPLDAQLPLTDAIVLNTTASTGFGKTGTSGVGMSDATGREQIAEAAKAPTRLASLRREFLGPVLAAHAEATGDLSWLAAQPLIAFAGIANPDRFFALLEACGGRISERHAFKDHHTFRGEDARRLMLAARSNGAALVTTEKDHVRLQGADGDVLQLAGLARTLPIHLAFEDSDARRADALLAAALSAGGYRAGFGARRKT